MSNHSLCFISPPVFLFSSRFQHSLIQLMSKYHKNNNRVLVFVLYKKEAPRVERLLRGKGYKVGAVHGDMSQFDRTQV